MITPLRIQPKITNGLRDFAYVTYALLASVINLEISYTMASKSRYPSLRDTFRRNLVDLSDGRIRIRNER